MKQKIKVVVDPWQAKPYAVFVECRGFYQQLSPWYYYHGCAVRYAQDYVATHDAEIVCVCKKFTFEELCAMTKPRKYCNK